jgi:hypothetical protein
VSGDIELRAFYEACGLGAEIIESALRKRYEKPTNFAGWEREAARVARAKKRNSTKNCRPK